MNIEQARFNMIEQQIRPWEVLDQRILDLLAEVPREDFVPAGYRDLAFADMMIPLEGDKLDGECMMQPKVEARLLQALAPEPGDTVLEVGTGSGYVTALLGHLAYFVHSVEIRPDFCESALETLNAAKVTNLRIENGDGVNGWPQSAPYDCILLTGSVPAVGDALREQLNPGGRLVAVVGEDPVMEAVLMRRVGETGWESESLFDTQLKPLVNAARQPAFEF